MPDVTFGAVSLQLKGLLEAGLVEAREEKRFRYYKAKREALGPMAGMLERMWDDALWKLKLAAELEESRRGPKRTQAKKEESMKPLPYAVHRDILIEADRETVFGFFTDSARWATWWGAGSTVDARPGGALRIRHSNGVVSEGEVLELAAPERFVFTFSLQSERPIPAEESRVTIRLEQQEAGTLVRVTHEVADAVVASQLVQGWRFHFSMFANAVANLVNAGAPDLVDAWFALWTEPDAATREAILRRIAVPGVKFRDRYSRLDGIDEVVAHIGASQKFMPGMRMERKESAPLPGNVLAEWVARASDGKVKMSGTNVFVLGPGVRIESVTSVSGVGGRGVPRPYFLKLVRSFTCSIQL